MMTEETFVRELERHADRVHGAPLSFEDVRGKARSIRRRRRVAAAGAAAAAVAVVAVVPAVLSGRLDRADAPQPAPAPSHTAHTAVLHDGRVTLPDGSTEPVDLDNADVSQLGLLSDGRIVAATSQPFAVRVYAPGGALEQQYPVQSNAITMSADDGAVAWVAKDFSVRVLASGSAEPTTLPGIPMPGESAGSIDAVLDPAHLLVGDGTTTSAELTPTGVHPLDTSQDLRVTDVSRDGGLWAVRVDGPDPQYGCSGLYDPGQHRLVAKNCETSDLRFSPDGRHLLGARGDNSAYGEVTVLDRGLKVVTSYAAPKGQTISRFAWEDDSHLLVSTVGLRDNRWSLVRVGLDGSPDQVLDGPGAGRIPEIAAEYLFTG